MSEQGARKFAEAKDNNGNTVIEFMGPPRSNDALSLCLRILTHQLMLKTPDSERGGGFFGGAYGYGVDFENEVFMMHRYCWCEKDDCLWCAGSGCQSEVPREPHRQGCYQQRTREFARQYGELLGVFDGRECFHVPYGSKHQKRYESFKRKLCAEMGFSYESGNEVHCSCGVDSEWRERYDACQCDWHLGRGIYRYGAAKSAPHFWHKASGLQVRWYKYIGRSMEIKAEPSPEWDSLARIFGDVLASISAPAIEECAKSYELAEEEEAERTRKSFEWMGSKEGQQAMQKMLDSGAIQVFGTKPPSIHGGS